RSGDRDHRIEEAPRLGDDVREALVVRVGEIALEGRGLDLVDRQDGEDERLPAERIEVRADDDAPFVGDALSQIFEPLRPPFGQARQRIEPRRSGLRLAPRRAALLVRRSLRCRRFLRGHARGRTRKGRAPARNLLPEIWTLRAPRIHKITCTFALWSPSS